MHTKAACYPFIVIHEGVVANAGGPKKFFRPPRKAGKTYRQPDWLIEQQAAQLLAKELGDDDGEAGWSSERAGWALVGAESGMLSGPLRPPPC